MESTMTDTPIAISFAQASKLTSISKSTLRRAARQGKLRTVPFGRRRIILYTALNDLLRNGLGNESAPETL